MQLITHPTHFQSTILKCPKRRWRLLLYLLHSFYRSVQKKGFCFPMNMIIIIIITGFLYSAFPNYDQSASQCIITPVIGFRHNSALKVHFLYSLGSIPASRRFIGAHVPTQPQFRSHPTGSPFNTWVESSNVDKVSCWRTKVPCESGNRTRTLSVRVERSLHYTTAPPQMILLIYSLHQIFLHEIAAGIVCDSTSPFLYLDAGWCP